MPFIDRFNRQNHRAVRHHGHKLKYSATGLDATKHPTGPSLSLIAWLFCATAIFQLSCASLQVRDAPGFRTSRLVFAGLIKRKLSSPVVSTTALNPHRQTDPRTQKAQIIRMYYMAHRNRSGSSSTLSMCIGNDAAEASKVHKTAPIVLWSTGCRPVAAPQNICGERMKLRSSS